MGCPTATTSRARRSSPRSPAPPTPEALLDDLPEGGYGLSLIRAAVDELRHERSAPSGENRWQLLKRLPEAATPPG